MLTLKTDMESSCTVPTDGVASTPFSKKLNPIQPNPILFFCRKCQLNHYLGTATLETRLFDEALFSVPNIELFHDFCGRHFGE